MPIKLKIKKGDLVEVITGNDKGKTGLIKKVFPKASKVIVENCKVVKKAIKPTNENSKGGFENKEMPIHISNVRKVEEEQ